MDTLTFISSLAQSLGWPLAIIVGIVLLRRPLSELLPHLSELKWKDFSLVFSKGVADAKAQLPSPENPKALQPPQSIESERLEQLALLSPRAAVMEAWVGLESAALSSLVSVGAISSSSGLRNHGRTAVALQSAGLLLPPEVIAFQELQHLRNQAAHAPEFALESSAVIEFVRVSEQLKAAISGRVRT